MPGVDAARALRFRALRQGLGRPDDAPLAATLAAPACEVVRGSAILAIAARTAAVDRAGYDAAVDAGTVVVAHALRGALHALAPADAALLGRALVAEDAGELGRQLGDVGSRHLLDAGLDPRAGLEAVAAACADALREEGPLDRVALHAALRARLAPAYLPWCAGCGSHHVSPMVWRYALVLVGARRDAAGRYVPGAPLPDRDPHDAVRRFLAVYGPGTVDGLRAWAGLAPAQARRLWAAVADEVVPVAVEGRRAYALAGDVGLLADPPPVLGLRLLPPGDPFLAAPSRALLAPDRALRARLFRPVASPGAVLVDGAVAGLWRVRADGRRAALSVEALRPLDGAALEREAARVAALRGAEAAVVAVVA